MNLHFTITETHESDAHKKSNHTARAAYRKDNPPRTRYRNVPIKFVCIDGEGTTLPDGSHRYVLLGIGDKQISNADGLDWKECFQFLWDNFREGSVAYTGFFLTYDFVQWLKSLREERARMLLTAEGRAKRQPKSDKRRQPFPVECDGWEFDILSSKRLRLRKKGAERWMNICDTGSFFQKSFLAVIDPAEWSDPVVTPEEYDTICTGKSGRSSAVLDSDMRKYNALENDVLSRVLPRLDQGFRSLGIYLRPNQWYGPGQASQTWLDNRAITSVGLQEVTPTAVLESARKSYYGGWFEIMAHGIVPGTTYEYDINSAYPYIISTLPCLEHGKWRHNHDVARDSSYALVRARVYGSDPYVGSMLHRDGSGNISRPHHTEGWYWNSELQAAWRAGLIDKFIQYETWEYIPCSCPPPLAEVAEIYELRRRVGKKTPLGVACKLVINSIYGKFAQSVGAPKYGNPVYASMITSGCREMILDAIATHPAGTRDVLMVATDGVYFRTPHNELPISANLGEWDRASKANLLLFKPGVYWDNVARENIRAGKAPVFKARGVNARDFGKSLGDVDAMFSELSAAKPVKVQWPAVTFPVSFSMVTAVQALQRGKWELAGTLVTDPENTQSSDPRLKRSSWYWDDDILRSRPVRNDPYEASHPYEKRFGIEDPFSDESMESGGISPDGYPGNLWKEALYG